MSDLYLMKRNLRIFKFGGTSVGDARRISRAVEIISDAAKESRVVVVVSAMEGVTNKLVQAASSAEAGDEKAVLETLGQLRRKHEVAANELIHSRKNQENVRQKMDELLEELSRLCQGTVLLGELTPQVRDAIFSFGERLSVLLVATALNGHGIPSEAIEATELIVTDGTHGAAVPLLDLTEERCRVRLLPLLERGVVPVVTGYIGATAEGVLTTLGRGGSDYSASIVGAALHVDEVVIWTDVDGLLTADPRFVAEACTIPEVSYWEATELAFFGAKVLHPKTILPLIRHEITLSIRNSFEPGNVGTRITSNSVSRGSRVTAVTAVADATLITIGGPAIAHIPDVLDRIIDTTREVRSEILSISQSSSYQNVHLVVPCNQGAQTAEGLLRALVTDAASETGEHIKVDSSVAVVTVVGKEITSSPEVMERILNVLQQERVAMLAQSDSESGNSISLVVARKDAQPLLLAIHREFCLGAVDSRTVHTIEQQAGPLSFTSLLGSATAD